MITSTCNIFLSAGYQVLEMPRTWYCSSACFTRAIKIQTGKKTGGGTRGFLLAATTRVGSNALAERQVEYFGAKLFLHRKYEYSVSARLIYFFNRKVSCCEHTRFMFSSC